MLGQITLTRRCQNMLKARIYIILLVLISPESFSADLMDIYNSCLLYTSPSPRDRTRSRMPSSA